MRGAFWPVLNRIVTACIWVSDLVFPREYKMSINFILSSDFKPTGEVNVSHLCIVPCGMLSVTFEAIKIILGALIGPKFIGMRNTLPLSAHVDTSSLISFFIFMAIWGRLSCLLASRNSD